MDKSIQDKIEEVQSKINEMQDKLEELKRVAAEKDNPYFSRSNEGACYYTIDPRGYVIKQVETGDTLDHARYAVANYSRDKKLLEKRAAEETLSRLIWREAEIANAGKTRKDCKALYVVGYYAKDKSFMPWIVNASLVGSAEFFHIDDARSCIKNVIIPFVKSHPELGWELAEKEE